MGIVASAELAGAATPTNTTPQTATIVTSLPFEETFPSILTPLTSSTDVGATLVAGVCQAGQPLLAAGWFSYRASDAQAILITANDFTYPSGARSTGVAVVSADLGTVLACDVVSDARRAASSGPVALAAGQTVYLARWVAPYTSGEEDARTASPAAYITRTSGVVPPNDAISNATPVTSLPFTQTIDTTLATQDGPRGGNCYDYPGNSVWWTFTPTVSGPHAVTVTSDSAAYEPCVSLFVRTGSDQYNSAHAGELQAGVEYLIKVSAGFSDYYPARLDAGGLATLRVAALDQTAPVWTKLPTTSVPLAAQLTTQASVCRAGVFDSTLPVVIDFAAADPQTGISGYRANGVYVGSSTRVTAIVSEGGQCAPATRPYTVTALNGDGTESTPAYWTPARLAVVEDANLTAAGKWWTVRTSSASAGSLRRSTTAGATLTYRIPASLGNDDGTVVNSAAYAFALIAGRGPGNGEVNVVVDGVTVASVDTYAATATARTVVWRQTLTAGAHTVRVVNLGTAGRSRADIDALVFVKK